MYVCIYLTERERDGEPERDRERMIHSPNAQDPGTQSRSLTWGAGTQLFEALCRLPRCALAVTWILWQSCDSCRGPPCVRRAAPRAPSLLCQMPSLEDVSRTLSSASAFLALV